MMRGAAHEYRIEVGTTSSTGAGRLPFQFVHRLLLLCTTRDTLHKKKTHDDRLRAARGLVVFVCTR